MSDFEPLKEWLNRTFPFSRNQADGSRDPSPTLLDLSRHIGDLTDRYFQVQIKDIEHVPREGGAVLVSNHGFLMVETVVLHNVILRHTGRAVRPVAAHMAWNVPLFNRFVAAAGGIQGDPDTVVRLLQRKELVLIYPGGVREAAKGSRDREKLFWEGRLGFVRAAMRAGTPIVPTAIRGADDVYVRIGPRFRGLGALLGDRDAAVQFFVGLGPFPLPAPLTFRFGMPISTGDGPVNNPSPEAVADLQAKVKQCIEHMLDEENHSAPSEEISPPPRAANE